MHNIISKKILIETAGVVAAIVAAVLVYTNVTIKTKAYSVREKALNKTLDKTIVHISDLHSYRFGNKNIKLIEKIKECDPDIIVMTGDMIDAHHPDFEATEELLYTLKEMCPCFYIEGNHEAWAERHSVDGYDEYIERIKKNGITVLFDEKYQIPDTNIVIYGLSHYFPHLKLLEDINNDEYSIVLCHDPIHADEIAEYKPDLVLAGHTHGGQVYIPGIGGLFTHGQGLKAKYITGKWEINNTTLIVNNGLGSSKSYPIHLRINVFPEIINIKT